MTKQPKTWITNDSAYSAFRYPLCQWLWTDNPNHRCLASIAGNEAEVYILEDQYVPAIKEFLTSNGFKAESTAQIAEYLTTERY